MTATAVTSEPHEATGFVASRRRRVPWATVVVVAWVVAYALFMAARFVPALSEPDDNGYFAQGSLLAQTGRTWFVAESDAQYIGMHWLLTPDGKYVSRYPPGLGVVIAAVERVAGWRAAGLVNPVLAVGGLIGFYLLARRLVGPWWAVAGTVMLGMMPEYLHHGLAFDSHTAVAFCVIWGLYLLVRWWDESKWWQVFAAGLILGCIPTIRYPDAVVGLGVGLFILAVVGRRWAHVAAAIAGAAVPVAALAVRNQLVMGAFWRTGYALTNEQTGFSFAYFREHAIQYVQQLNANGVGPIFAIGVMGIAWMVCTARRRWLGVMLAGMVVPMVLLYMAYYWAPQGGGGMTMRFLVPIFAVLVLAAVWVMAEFTQAAPAKARMAVGLSVVALQLLWGTADTWRQGVRMQGTKAPIAKVTSELEEVAAAGSVVIADNAMLQHLDYVRRWKLADASLVRGGRMGGPPPGMGRPGEGEGRPSPRQAEKDEVRRAKYAGSQRQRQEKFAADVLAWADGAKVYYVGAEEGMEDVMGAGTLRVVERVKLPEQPAGGMRAGGGPGMMGPGGGVPFGGPGGRRVPGGPGGGFGPMGRPGMGGGPPGGGGGIMGGLGGLREVVVAEWSPPDGGR